MKRVLDITAATVGLIALSPLLIILSILIWLQDYHSPFYVANRMGRGERPFRMVKFRSMIVRADLSGVDSTAGDDPRITSLGKFIRRFKLDEIPQLWNVLKGEMSLVGPRPALRHETEAWDPLLTQRLRVKPGLTGMWQVNGRSESSFEDYTRLDLYYVDNWSLLIDLAILAKTVPVVLLRQGAS